MSSLTPDQFEAFYQAATLAIAELELAERRKREPAYQPKKLPRAKSPFPWQNRLATRVCGGDWPRAIALPTAAGKTACIDVAVFALACRAKDAPRRVFFVVDRRIVVDQAYEHAKGLATVLDRARGGVLHETADALREIAKPGWLHLSAKDRTRILNKRWAIQDERDEAARKKLLRGLTEDERKWFEISPLDVYALRGGMYRESAWARSPLQPTVIASTVDQVGSRLLFRGYGVSNSMKPVHAGLVGNDSIILLDEAHCARPFEQTMQAVDHYRSWGETTPAPFRFVSVTATPAGELSENKIERDNDEDRSHPVLGPRIAASKPAKLTVAKKARGKNGRGELVKVLEQHARELVKEFPCVGIIVNRVATARELAVRLGEGTVLLTGRMRPLDRDRIFDEQLQPLLSGEEGTPPKFVVGTQCLECGADFDFHALVTECASLDALRQRFGRLNRIAARAIARAVIVIRGDQLEDSSEDPVYESGLANAWKWMNENADGNSKDEVSDEEVPWIDFGVSSIRAKWDRTNSEEQKAVVAPAVDAPVLFPAHLDCWVQTNPVPEPDPDPALFLHGPKQTGQPDVKVVLRSDLGENPNRWAEIVALCPPSSSEAVPVPIGVFKEWLSNTLEVDDTADVEGGRPSEEAETEDKPEPRVALRWRGPEDSDPVFKLKEVTPNDVYVIPVPPLTEESERAAMGRLADFDPDLCDYGDQAFQRSRDKAVIRFTPAVVNAWPEAFRTEGAAELAKLLGEAEDNEDFEERLDEVLNKLAAIDVSTEELRPWSWLKNAAAALERTPRGREYGLHPMGGLVVLGKRRLFQFDPTYLDDTEPDQSFRGRERVLLEDHSHGVAHYAERFALGCGLPSELYKQVGLWHDIGKLDQRFQAMLKGCSPRTAVGPPFAKSGRSPGTPKEQAEARQVHRYPSGARHELLSAAIVAGKTDDDLMLHLIATHHGSARPFASPITDPIDDPEANRTLRPELFGEEFRPISNRQQIEEWNTELPERFWRVVRQFGWWGSAYREAVFRLADHAQSREEQEREQPHHQRQQTTPSAVWPPVRNKPDSGRRHQLPLTGLDGANPLAFLAAVGTLVACDRVARSEDDRPGWLVEPPRLSWRGSNSPQVPTLTFSAEPPGPPAFAAFLADHLSRTIETHPAAWAVEAFEQMQKNKEYPLAAHLRRQCLCRSEADRSRLDWVTALVCETAPKAASQLLTVRRDYLPDNLRSVLDRTTAAHLRRALFDPWDYADALNNQSLHWEPSEDRRHAYQWHQPNGDPTRARRGGMLGANRLALEAWPLFPSFPDENNPERVNTRGFRGNRASNTFWIWPLWSSCLTPSGVASMLSLRGLVPATAQEPVSVRHLGVTAVYRSQRILVNKTPNLTPAAAIA